MDDDDRKPNPRGLGFFPDQRSKASVAPDLAQKPTPAVLDRYRAMLREREEEARVSVGEVGSDDIVRIYEEVLAELTFNSKPIITELTIIAGDQIHCAEGIAEAICARILEVPVQQKLPSLYLLDSIAKNIGGDYVGCFATRLPQVFCEAYRQVEPNLYPAMRHLFGTWSAVFPSSVLRMIEGELQFSPSVTRQRSSLTPVSTSEAPSPRPGHGIHVNPKYLGRRQLENSTMDVQQGKRIPSNLSGYGRKATVGYGEPALDQGDELPLPQLGTGRGVPEQSPSMHPSTIVVAGRHAIPSKTRITRPTSPSRIEPSRTLPPASTRLASDISSAGFSGRSPPDSRSGLRNGERNTWWERRQIDDGLPQIETSSVYHVANGSNLQRQRVLVDSYGSYTPKGTVPDRVPKLQKLDVNGVNSESVTRRWQNSEEEEYDWEDMSPTLADRSRGNDVIPPGQNRTGNLGMTSGPGRPHSNPSFTRDWPSQGHPSILDDSANLVEDRTPFFKSGRGALNKMPSNMGMRNELLPKFQGSGYSQDSWNLSYNPSRSSVPYSLPASGVSSASLPFPSANGSTAQKGPLLIDNPPFADAAIQRLPSGRMRNVPSNANPVNVKAAPALEKHIAQEPSLPHNTSVPVSHRPPSSRPSLLHQKQMKNQYDHFVNQVPTKSLDDVDQNLRNPINQVSLAHQRSGLISFAEPSQGQENLVTSHVKLSSNMVTQTQNHSGRIKSHGMTQNMALPNSYDGITALTPANSMPEESFRLHRNSGPPLPPGPPPIPNQMGTMSRNTNASGGAFSGLISTLVAQGLISVTTPGLSQGSLGVEFDVELLKVRHEFAINALYVDLPRQCTTCGMRFKCQEEHSNHMDWHVTKNRMSKNRKQNPSRKWFVNAKEWLSGAEALGTDVAPGFLPIEALSERKIDEDMAVPADEHQNVCALCGEPFEDFYSDETEEWMYKGAVYMNAPDGSFEGMDRTLLGPIVHAKCRSESTRVSAEESVQAEEANEEGSPRKKMRR